jgi:tRNA 2-thiouridine synthesizing protein A
MRTHCRRKAVARAAGEKPLTEGGLTMGAEYKVDQTVDYRGLFCPMPIVKVSKAIRGIEAGQVLEMLADDPGSKPDMQAWVRQTGHELLDIKEEGGVFKFYVRRTK